ncbi:hypothetical protein CKO28_10305 [Rhodovibrio sodomensis]|uniref:Uncharacterized protein n=1 Tax=Rhodovibrio sodomensis TaxID=1088 RepID=A0ABS1DEN4_9PROT|nr:hypothetical protein [Rhodovibrio sodomensis]MBK1668426.1 hypothetical protein [Rhodovibrio sodomensis]
MAGRQTSSKHAILSNLDDSAHPTSTGGIDANALSACERAIFDRWADRNGHVADRDIDTLLRQNLILRRLIADLVASAGRPKPGQRAAGYIAEVPTDVIEQVGQHGDFSHIEDIETACKSWY